MIIYENKCYEMRSDMPDDDWTGEALYVVQDGSPLAAKIAEHCPYYDFVTDENGNLIDITPTERPPEPEPEPSAEHLLNILLGVTDDASQ